VFASARRLCRNMLLAAIIIAQIVWLPAPDTGNVFHWPSQTVAPANGLAFSDVSTEEVCRVTLVGTNAISSIDSFLGMTNWPSESAQWWEIWKANSNAFQTPSVATQDVEVLDIKKIFGETNFPDWVAAWWSEYDKRATNSESEVTGQEGAAVASAHGGDFGTATFATSQSLTAGAGGESLLLHFTVGGVSRTIDCDPSHDATANACIAMFRAFILACAGVWVAYAIVKDWRSLLGKMNDARQAMGFGVEILGNNAPNLFAQINAGIMTLVISGAGIALTAAAVGICSVWLVGVFSDVAGNSIALYLFNLFVPVAGLFSIAGVWLGWIATGALAEYLVKIAGRHTTA